MFKVIICIMISQPAQCNLFYDRQLEDHLANLSNEKDDNQTQMQEFKETIKEITTEDNNSLIGIVDKVIFRLFEMTFKYPK